MQAPDPIEAALSRLMPSALSVGGQRSIEAMLDELAGGSEAAVPPPLVPVRPALWRRAVPAGIAAAAALLATVVTHPDRNAAVADLPPSDRSADIVLVGESDRIEEMTDEGWTTDPDGSAMKAVRIRVIGESSLRDGRTGIVVQVTQPREEMVLMPVTAF